MANAYYNHANYPANGAFGSSSALRAELELIEAGFNLLPTLSGNGSKIVSVNSGADALTVTDTTGSGNVVLATSPTITTPAFSRSGNGDVATFTNGTRTAYLYAGASAVGLFNAAGSTGEGIQLDRNSQVLYGFAGGGSIFSARASGDFNVLSGYTTNLTGAVNITGAATLSSTLDVTGSFNVNTNKFSVAASTGNTTVAGTLAVTGATTLAALSATTGAFSDTISGSRTTQGAMAAFQNTTRPCFHEFLHGTGTAKASVGMLGSAEANLSWNMDYTTGVHRLYDQSSAAAWVALSSTGLYFQYAPATNAAGDVWTGQGSLIPWQVTVAGDTTQSGSITAGTTLKLGTYTVATLPDAGTVGAGTTAFVSDSSVFTLATPVSGGGAGFVPVYSNGAGWYVG